MFDKTETFDAIIVGAGPAGASCARELSKLGRRVLLFERSNEIGEPNFSSAGTPKSTMKDFDIPLECAGTSWNKLVLGGPSEVAEFTLPETAGYVLDFRKLKKLLVREAIVHGAKVLVGTTVKDIIKNNDGASVGVSYSGGLGSGEAYAKIIIDATGPSGLLAQKIGLREARVCNPSIGLEAMVHNVPEKWQHTMAFYFGHEFAPNGYAWIFSMGEHEAKIGVCIFDSKNNQDLKTLLHTFIHRFPEFKDVQPSELHGGMWYASGGIKKHVADHFIVIGDAATQINPLGAEGIRHCLWSGRFAAEVIDGAVKADDFSKSTLSVYEKKWENYVGKKWALSKFIKERLYHTLDDSEYDALVRASRTVSSADALAILFEYNYKLLFKVESVVSLAKSKVMGFFSSLR